MNDGCGSPIDTTRCKGCSYRAFDPNLGIHCNYLLITGHARRCDPGGACDKFTTEPVGRDPDQWANNFLHKKGNTGESTELRQRSSHSRPG